MKRKIRYFALFLLSAILLSALGSCQTYIGRRAFTADSLEKQIALSQIKKYYETGRFHQGSILHLAELCENSPFNYSAFTTAAKLASRYGHSTGTIVEIAEIASRADREHKEFIDLLEQAVRLYSRHGSLVAAAENLINAGTAEELAAARERINELTR
jgi:hypothetical protein